MQQDTEGGGEMVTVGVQPCLGPPPHNFAALQPPVLEATRYFRDQHQASSLNLTLANAGGDEFLLCPCCFAWSHVIGDQPVRQEGEPT